MQSRNKKGQFGRKSDTDRKVRSIRVTDDAWEKFGEMATCQGITRADLLEKMISNDALLRGDYIEVLEGALKLKANAGGAIKKKIREFLLFAQSI